MIIVYDSVTGVGKQFAESLGYPTQSIKEKLEEPCILITRNAGAGKIPGPLSALLRNIQA